MQLSEVWIRNYISSVSYPEKVAPLHPSKFGNVQGKCLHISWSFCHFRSSTSPRPEGSFLAPEISRLFGDTVGASHVVLATVQLVSLAQQLRHGIRLISLHVLVWFFAVGFFPLWRQHFHFGCGCFCWAPAPFCLLVAVSGLLSDETQIWGICGSSVVVLFVLCCFVDCCLVYDHSVMYVVYFWQRFSFCQDRAFERHRPSWRKKKGGQQGAVKYSMQSFKWKPTTCAKTHKLRNSKKHFKQSPMAAKGWCAFF